MLKTNTLKILSLFIYLLVLLIQSCERLELKRLMDTSTDSISISGTTVTVYGTALDLGEGRIIEHGHCWAIHPDPSINDMHSELGTIEGTALFYSHLSSIIPGIKHYARSYMFDGDKYTYGNEVNFEVTPDDISFHVDSISVLTPGTIEVNSSTFGIGSVVFTDHGHCWSKIDPPTIQNNFTSFGTYQSDTTYSSVINNLVEGRYFIRAYLMNGETVVYSPSFKYESKISVETDIISLNVDSSIKADGRIISLGINQITNHGHCWSSVTSNPNYNDEHSSLGPVNIPISFSSQITGLEKGRKYFIKAYATDGINVYYGKVRSIIAK